MGDMIDRDAVPVSETLRKNRIKALEIAIMHLCSQRCPIGQWPSVVVLRKWVEELKAQEKLHD